MNDALAEEIASLQAVYGDDACVCEPYMSQMLVTLNIAPQRQLRITLPEGYPDCEDGKVTARMLPPVGAQATSRLAEYCDNEVMCGGGEAVVFPLASWVEGELLPTLEETPKQAKSEEQEEELGEQVLQRQWLWFIGFYTKSIRKAFCETAASLGCTGFLMPGKPAVAAVEGTSKQIAEFIRITRTELFASVAPASRKMTLSLLDDPITNRAFTGFDEVDITAAPATHKRKDMADLGGLQTFLESHGVAHAFAHIFQGCV
eukprot:TRINITY_DN6785_c0_g1_i1.p3 TRINITY_DN6785_c0_g1~~TRINITY_DN6785_c0_g1_i1.p3  ORF type:complete len:260 (+),score=62.26 TRINITY_DN6785_c0_g1_i1:1698-2477(+)